MSATAITDLTGAERPPAAAEHRQLPAGPPAIPRGRSPRHLGWWTVGLWVASVPLAMLPAGVIGLSPLTLRGSAPPLLIGVMLLAGGILAMARWPGEVLPHLAVAAFAGWIVLTMHTALYGTPYGFGGILGDLGRVTAMANRYSHTVHSSDGIVRVPSDYPPLFPWLIGRASALSGIAAWRLMGLSEAILTSAAVVLPFLLWRRLLPAGVAFVVTLACFTVFVAPSKPYEVLALGLVVPWVILTFAAPPRGRLPWLGAGIIGGLQVILYQAWVMFAVPAILALVVLGLRRPDRWAYARRVVGVVVTGAVVSSGYLVPYLHWSLTHGLEMTDRFQNAAIGANPFPFLALTPIGLLTVIGVVGLIRYRRETWWAQPIGLIVLSDYVYRFISEIGYIADGQTGVFQYTASALTATLAIAAALTLWQALPGILRRLSIAGPTRALSISLVAALVAAVGVGMWHGWMPGDPATRSGQLSLTDHADEATQAFEQPLPDGRYVGFAPAVGRQPWFPISEVVRDVAEVRGPTASPETLSVSEELYDFRSWPGYLGVSANAAAATSEWYSRLAALETLSRLRSPAAFAAASARTPFGPIDTFILQRDGSAWTWTPTSYDAEVRFRPADFSTPAFRVFTDLPGGLVLVVRRPASRTDRSRLRPARALRLQPGGRRALEHDLVAAVRSAAL